MSISLIGALVVAALVASNATAGVSAPAGGYQISLTTTPSSIITGQPATFTGTISSVPPPALERVSLWRRLRHGWVLLIVHRAPTSGRDFSITRTFAVPSRHGPTMLRICLPRRAYRVRTCTAFAVAIQPAKPQGNQTARERHKHKLEEAQRRKEEKRQKKTDKREEQRKRREEARRSSEEKLHKKKSDAHEERRKRKEEARIRREERRASQ